MIDISYFQMPQESGGCIETLGRNLDPSPKRHKSDDYTAEQILQIVIIGGR